jgi:hypothetical protein
VHRPVIGQMSMRCGSILRNPILAHPSESRIYAGLSPSVRTSNYTTTIIITPFRFIMALQELPPFPSIQLSPHPSSSNVKITRYYETERIPAAIRIPEGYVEVSEGELEVEISGFGRHETIPIVGTLQRIRNLTAIALGTLALVTPYVFIAVFTGFQTGSISTPQQRGFVISWLVTG